MRKFICLFIIGLIIFSGISVFANEAIIIPSDDEINQMSYEDLIDLHDSLNMMIWESADWFEVIVPMGYYVVGKDIPAGHYNVCSVSNSGLIFVYSPDVENPNMYDAKGEFDDIDLNDRDKTELELENGQLIEIYMSNVRFYKSTISVTRVNLGFSGLETGSDFDVGFALIDLAATIENRIRELDEYEEVVVPEGVYQIGVSIPSGQWTIRPEPKGLCGISYSIHLNSNGELYNSLVSVALKDPNRRTYDSSSDIPKISLPTIDGYYLGVSYGSVIFETYTGATIFDFKE